MKREMPDAAMIQSSEAIENVVKTNGDNHVIFYELLGRSQEEKVCAIRRFH